ESTKRRHPHSGAEGLAEAIDAERTVLSVVREEADLVIDTSRLNVHELRQRITELFGSESNDTGMRVQVVSFGYKHGLPLEADLVFDCRFLPNPYWVDELRPLSGLDDPVREFVLRHESATAFLDELDRLLGLLLPAFVAEGKAYLTIAIGCTGGRHRSVAVAEDLARRLRVAGVGPTVHHRDMAK
ncbi:MAG: RNase adapter RapZ, partial [Acidimicrobiales bacterium]